MAEENGSYGKKPMWQSVLTYLIVAGVVYAGVYYFVLKKPRTQNTGSQNQYANSTPVPSVSTPTGIESTTKMAVDGNEFAFTPSTLTAKVGKPFEITFKNTGKYPHNLSIAELNVKTKTVQSGEQDSVLFTPDKAGSYEFICTVPGHADRGMKGTLVVE